MNNPIMYADPSGHSLIALLGALFATATVIATSALAVVGEMASTVLITTIASLPIFITTVSAVSEFAITTTLLSSPLVLSCVGLYYSVVGLITLFETWHKKNNSKSIEWEQNASDFLSKDPGAVLNSFSSLDPSNSITFKKTIATSSRLVGGNIKAYFDIFDNEPDDDVEILFKL